MNTTLIKNASIVNENKIFRGDVLIKNGRIEKIDHSISVTENCLEIDATDLHLLPGCIDDQVHFREPGLTHKGYRFKSCCRRRYYVFYGYAQYHS